MDLKQYFLEVAPLLTLGACTFAVSYFFYRLNKETINEWREEHAKQIEKSENRIENMIKEWRTEHIEQLKENKPLIKEIDAK